jgi:hypothetical protein
MCILIKLVCNASLGVLQFELPLSLHHHSASIITQPPSSLSLHLHSDSAPPVQSGSMTRSTIRRASSPPESSGSKGFERVLCIECPVWIRNHNVSEITMLLDFSPPFLLCCLARILSYSQLLHTSKHISMCKFLWATC